MIPTARSRPFATMPSAMLRPFSRSRRAHLMKPRKASRLGGGLDISRDTAGSASNSNSVGASDSHTSRTVTSSPLSVSTDGVQSVDNGRAAEVATCVPSDISRRHAQPRAFVARLSNRGRPAVEQARHFLIHGTEGYNRRVHHAVTPDDLGGWN